MDLVKEFQGYIRKENLFQPKDKLLLAVSGGVDSVVLCELCKQAGYDFVIVHCNFQLRGEESERDEEFVRGLAVRYGVEFLVKRFDTLSYAEERKTGIQEAARNLRYEWFFQICVDKNLGNAFDKPAALPGWHSTVQPDNIRWFVVTAHHLDDSIETMLMNFFMGTGIKGLKGILPKHDLLTHLVRPLLFAHKDELVKYAGENDLPFVEDSSNASDKYTRNYFRNKLIPALKEVFPQVEENLANNLQRFREVELIYKQFIDLQKKKLLEEKGAEIHIPVLKLSKTVPLRSIVYEIIRDYHFTANQTDECIALLQSDTGKYIQSPTHRIIKNRNWLIISPNQPTAAQNILIEEENNSLDFEAGKLELKGLPTSNFKLQTSNSTAQLDAAEIKFPLLLRKWKQGDYFYPLGMNKKKKISRFLIDQKLSLTQKENVWVIEMNRKIIWVVGLRIDDRFKITDKTSKRLQLVFTESRGA